MSMLATEHLAAPDLDDELRDGPSAFLLHGWPDDATPWAAVAPGRP